MSLTGRQADKMVPAIMTDETKWNELLNLEPSTFRILDVQTMDDVV